MTQFEYISVAISLILALAVSDIIRALVPAARPRDRYWPHFMWLIAMVLNIAYSWWAIWNMRSVSWTGLLFVYVLLNPALLTVMARLLARPDVSSSLSYRENFFRMRRSFYSVLLAFYVNGFIGSWVFGLLPVGEFNTLQLAALAGAAGAAAGIYLESDRAQTTLVIFALVLLLAALALTPIHPFGEGAA